MQVGGRHKLLYLRLELALKPMVCSAPTGAQVEKETAKSPMPTASAMHLRRALGKALIDAFCPFGEPICQSSRDCSQDQSCPYGVFFAATTGRRPPFAIYMRPADESNARQRMEITLYGDNWRQAPWMLWALSQALSGGLGKRRQMWKILQVDQVGRQRRQLCGDDLRQLTSIEPDDLVELARGCELAAPSRLQVRFLSPTRLLHEGRLLFGTDPVPLAVLISRTLDRLRDLYGDRAIPLVIGDCRQVLETSAGDIETEEVDIRWQEQRDYSARSKSELLLGGKVGQLVYGSGAGRFLPVLKLGEVLQVGKNVTAGCGRIAVRRLG